MAGPQAQHLALKGLDACFPVDHPARQPEIPGAYALRAPALQRVFRHAQALGDLSGFEMSNLIKWRVHRLLLYELWVYARSVKSRGVSVHGAAGRKARNLLAAKKQQNGERLRKSRTGCANGWVATDACGFRPAPPLSVDMLRSAAAQVTALVSLDVFEAVTHAAGRRR